MDDAEIRKRVEQALANHRIKRREGLVQDLVDIVYEHGSDEYWRGDTDGRLVEQGYDL